MHYIPRAPRDMRPIVKEVIVGPTIENTKKKTQINFDS